MTTQSYGYIDEEDYQLAISKQQKELDEFLRIQKLLDTCFIEGWASNQWIQLVINERYRGCTTRARAIEIIESFGYYLSQFGFCQND